MDSRKKVKSVFAGHYCLKFSPCIHEITVTYTDGSKEDETLNAKEIWRKYGDYLKEKDKRHFACYKKCYCFGLFDHFRSRSTRNTETNQELLLENVSQLRQ